MEIVTYLLGWVNGLFVGVSSGYFLNNYLRAKSWNDSCNRSLGLFQSIVPILTKIGVDYFGENIRRSYEAFPRDEVPKKENPKGEVPKNENPRNEAFPKNEFFRDEVPKKGTSKDEVPEKDCDSRVPKDRDSSNFNPFKCEPNKRPRSDNLNANTPPFSPRSC